MKHKFITGFFLTAIVLQFGLGIFMIYEVISQSAYPVLQLNFPDGHLCMYAEHRAVEITYTVLSLCFDVGVFIAVVVRFLWRRPSSVRLPSVVQTIVKDATVYVLLLCTSRVVFVCLSAFATDTGRITRFLGNNVFVPIMITRMLLSLKRTSAKGLCRDWDFCDNDEGILPSNIRITRSITRFSDPIPRIQSNKVITIAMETL